MSSHINTNNASSKPVGDIVQNLQALLAAFDKGSALRKVVQSTIETVSAATAAPLEKALNAVSNLADDEPAAAKKSPLPAASEDGILQSAALSDQAQNAVGSAAGEEAAAAKENAPQAAGEDDILQSAALDSAVVTDDEDEGNDSSDGGSDEDDCQLCSSSADFTDTDVVATLGVGIVAGAALLGGGILLYKLLSD